MTDVVSTEIVPDFVKPQDRPSLLQLSMTWNNKVYCTILAPIEDGELVWKLTLAGAANSYCYASKEGVAGLLEGMMELHLGGSRYLRVETRDGVKLASWMLEHSPRNGMSVHRDTIHLALKTLETMPNKDVTVARG